MKYAILALIFLSGCATARTKWTDPGMKVMLSPMGIEAGHYAKIQAAIQQNGRFILIDRGLGFDEVTREQEREYQADSDNRFQDREKLARWGKLHGVGGVVIAHAECMVKERFIFHTNYLHCNESLAIIDTVTAEVVATAQDEQNGDSNGYQSVAPSWDSAVDDLISAYPARFNNKTDEKNLREYKDMVAEEALRRKELAASGQERKPASQSVPAEYQRSAEEQEGIKQMQDAKKADKLQRDKEDAERHANGPKPTELQLQSEFHAPQVTGEAAK